VKKPLPQENSLELYRHSLKNKLPLLFLSTLERTKNLRNLKDSWEKEYKRYLETIKAIKKASELFNNKNIQYAFFKTIRPYISATVDIDVLVFGDKEEYLKAIKTMRSAGYPEKARGPASTTFQDPEIEIGIDLYQQVAFSYIPYIDSDKLVSHVTTTKLLDGGQIKILTPEADLLTIIAHSIIKENIYTLSEYYAYIYYLERLDLNRFVEIVRQTHLKSPTKTHTTITAMLYKAAHRTVPDKLSYILDRLGRDDFETAMLQKEDYNIPHKYHPVTIIRCLFEITREEKTRRAILTQMLHAFDPRFSGDFLEKLINHMFRETY